MQLIIKTRDVAVYQWLWDRAPYGVKNTMNVDPMKHQGYDTYVIDKSEPEPQLFLTSNEFDSIKLNAGQFGVQREAHSLLLKVVMRAAQTNDKQKLLDMLGAQLYNNLQSYFANKRDRPKAKVKEISVENPGISSSIYNDFFEIKVHCNPRELNGFVYNKVKRVVFEIEEENATFSSRKCL